MLKRRGPSSEHDRDCACTCKRARPPPATQKRHLYVALDDRDRAYSLYKLDVLDAAADDQAERRLPEPPVLRLEVPESGDTCHFAALGTKIIALSNRSPPLVHDTLTNALTIGSPRRPPRALSRFPSFTAAAAGRLLALPHAVTQDTYYLQEQPTAQQGQLGLDLGLGLAESSSGSNDDEEQTSRRSRTTPCRGRRRPWRGVLADMGNSKRRWAWSPADSRPPVPFDPRDIACHAVHPDGRIVFVSARRRVNGAASWLDHGTFSLDAGGGLSGEWTRHGGWLLPFKGQAFFEAQLDAWVGLDARGRLCSCDGVSRRGTRGAAPARKVCEDTLLLCEPLDPDSGQRNAVLAHMGDARFCVVERAARDGGGGAECVVHVTTFAVRYGKRGELKVAERRLVGSYQLVPRHNVFFKVQAFFV